MKTRHVAFNMTYSNVTKDSLFSEDKDKTVITKKFQQKSELWKKTRHVVF